MEEKYLPRQKLPARTFAQPQKRAPNRAVGIYSPFGQIFHQHGEVQLEIARKPVSSVNENDADLGVVGGSLHAGASKRGGTTLSAAALTRDDPLPPVVNRGLGLGLGLHPQRFPRELSLIHI